MLAVIETGKMTMGLLLIVTILTTIVHSGDPKKTEFSLNQHVTNVSHFFFTVDLGQIKYLTLSYNIIFSEESCCPILVIGPPQVQNSHVSKDNCLEKDISNLVLLSGGYMPMPNTIYQPKCRKVGSKYVCKGIWKFFRPYAIQWAGSLNYDCRHKKNLDIMLNLTFYIGKPQPCEDLQSQVCGDMFGYNKTIFPNLANHQSQNQSVWLIDLLSIFLRTSARSNKGLCYQHFARLTCFIAYPHCQNGVQYTVCRQMCHEMEEGCFEVLQVLKQPVYCRILPDSLDPDVCHYVPVICNIPEDLEFGTVTYEGRNPFNITSYVCHEGYRLKGEAQRVCLYSGRWNGSAPICVAIAKADQAVIIASVITAVIVLIIAVTAVCIWKRQGIRIFIWDCTFRKRGHFEVNEERKKKLFLTYSNNDAAIVEIFLPELKREIPAWDIITFQEDFQGGDSIIDSIHDGVWKSDAMLALLTENYIDSEWCQYEFTQAKTRAATDKKFKCIIILQRNNDREFVENLPLSFQDYAKSRIYLTYGEMLFWKKLRHALHAMTATAEQ